MFFRDRATQRRKDVISFATKTHHRKQYATLEAYAYHKEW